MPERNFDPSEYFRAPTPHLYSRGFSGSEGVTFNDPYYKDQWYCVSIEVKRSCKNKHKQDNSQAVVIIEIPLNRKKMNELLLILSLTNQKIVYFRRIMDSQVEQNILT